MSNFNLNSTIELDGSIYEGGGQILRTALALSALTKKPFIIKNIRRNRPQKGLKQQHLTAVNIVKELCNADVNGNFMGSEYLEFIPKDINFKNLNIDIGTAGSITLLLQALISILIFSDKNIKIKIIGGSDVNHSPSIDYFTYVFLPFLKEYIYYETELLKRGYYPKGNGEFIIKIKPKYSIKNYKTFEEFHNFLKNENKKIIPKKGDLIIIKGISHASKELMKNKVAERQTKFAKFVLKNYLLKSKKENIDIKIQTIYNETLSIGSGITLWALFDNNLKFESTLNKFNKENLDNEKDINLGSIFGSDNLGEKSKKAEFVGKECAEKLIKSIDSNYSVDEYMADQLLIYLALFGGNIKSNITEHVKANIYVIEKFLDVKFDINEKDISIK